MKPNIYFKSILYLADNGEDASISLDCVINMELGDVCIC